MECGEPAIELIIEGVTYCIASPLGKKGLRRYLHTLSIGELAQVTADLISLPQPHLNDIRQVYWLHDWLVAYGRRKYGDGFIGYVCFSVIGYPLG